MASPQNAWQQRNHILSFCHTPIPYSVTSLIFHSVILPFPHSFIPPFFHAVILPFCSTPIPPYPGTHVPALCLRNLTQVSDCQFGERGSQGSCYEELPLQKIASERGSGGVEGDIDISNTVELIQTPMGQKISEASLFQGLNCTQELLLRKEKVS